MEQLYEEAFENNNHMKHFCDCIHVNERAKKL